MYVIHDSPVFFYSSTCAKWYNYKWYKNICINRFINFPRNDYLAGVLAPGNWFSKADVTMATKVLSS